MRRAIAFVLTVLLAVSALAIAASARSAYTSAQITAAYGTPEIDGELDDIWYTTEAQFVIKVDRDVIPSNTITNGTVRVLWDEDYLYFFISVDKKDVPVYAGGGSENTDDCADVCFTMDGNFEGENNVTGGDEYAGVFRTLLDGSFGGFGDFQVLNIDKFKGVMKKTSETTYNSEYAIPWVDINPTPGYVISMEVQINDATDGARTGLVNWAYVPCLGWRDSKYHGTVTLLEPVDVPEPDEDTPDSGETAEYEAPAPLTGDTIAAITSLMLLSSAVAALLGKREVKK